LNIFFGKSKLAFSKIRWRIVVKKAEVMRKWLRMFGQLCESCEEGCRCKKKVELLALGGALAFALFGGPFAELAQLGILGSAPQLDLVETQGRLRMVVDRPHVPARANSKTSNIQGSTIRFG